MSQAIKAGNETKDQISVAFVPVYANPYQHLLTAALRDENVQVIHLDKMPSWSWLVRQCHSVDIIHLHWLSGLYMRRWLTPFQLLSFLGKIVLAQALGYKLVWTSHNILPHKLPFPPMHTFVRRFIMRRADAVIAHCEHGRRAIAGLFPRQKAIYVVPIGSYSGVYTIEVTRQQAKEKLNIPEGNFVYLFLGNIEWYKGIENFVDVFQLVSAAQDIALIAGRDRATGLVRRLQEISQNDERVRVHAGFIPDEEIQNFLRAADVMVLPFKEILTSSSVVTGMSYALPIIAPALGCLPELITPQAGLLYDAQDPDGLRKAIVDIKAHDTAEMGRAARAITDGLAWEFIARQTARIYRQCLTGECSE